MLLGYYVTCDDAVCLNDFDAAGGLAGWRARGGFEGWEEPIEIDESDEADTPTHCVTCGKLLEHELTDHGLDYVAEAIGRGFEEGKQNPVTRQWIDAYGEQLDDATMPQADGVRVPDAIGCYLLLPIDRQWIDRPELRRHAIQAGWTE